MEATMWTTLSDLDRTFAALDLFRRRLEEPAQPVSAPRFWMRESANGWLVKAEMPGVARDDLKVESDQGELTVRAVRRPLFEALDAAAGAGGPVAEARRTSTEADGDTLVRSFRLPRGVDHARIAAELKDGILTLTLPKLEEQKPKRIDVRAA
jgi:HSP20 family molecular chaperone IbpA